MKARDLSAYAAIVSACERGALVGRLTESSGVLAGTARSIGDERGMFLRGDADVETAHVRVTWAQGFDSFLPITELVDEYHAGTFVVDYSMPER